MTAQSRFTRTISVSLVIENFIFKEKRMVPCNSCFKRFTTTQGMRMHKTRYCHGLPATTSEAITITETSAKNRFEKAIAELEAESRKLQAAADALKQL
jgi:hypothetical protein